MFEVNNKKHHGDVNDVVLMFLWLTLNIFTTFSSVSIVDFEHVNVSWEQDHFVILFYVSFLSVQQKCRNAAFIRMIIK